MKRPEPLTFFLDRSLGRGIVANALRSADRNVKVHDDLFAPDAKDEAWLAEAGRQRWVVLTKDRRFHNRILEITALARANVRVFKLCSASMQGSEMAEAFLKAIKKIERVAVSNRAPFVATVTRSGRVSVVLTAAKLRKYR